MFWLKTSGLVAAKTTFLSRKTAAKCLDNLLKIKSFAETKTAEECPNVLLKILSFVARKMAGKCPR